ncbi:MAG: type II toxin-antitoxin system RelE/ParE family toxin [Bythopirellula sp.]|nr:type II toxin-antitoxin system RelE/ParE family toxin [Bythopirellula sp.]
MSFTVQVLPRALDDVFHITTWIANRSPQGAEAWIAAYEKMLVRLAEQPLACGSAPEANSLGRELRQALFRTRQGNTYRAVFLVQEATVYLLRVRGAGQPPLAADEI